MRSFEQQFNQRGVALFLALIMLLILTVLGVASFHNSHIQERSAGNARLQSLAFEAAAAGASDAINFFDANRDMAPDALCGSLGHEGWADATDWVDMGSFGDATLRQRMYCLADEYPDEEGGRPARSQFFVLSRGEITSGGEVVALRDVEVRLDLGRLGTPGDGCGAICFPGCLPGELDFPNSNAFIVDGGVGGGPAVTYNEECPAMGTAIDDAIRDNRIGNYHGGVEPTTPGAPWSDPVLVEEFRQHIEQASMTAGACASPTCFPGDLTDMGNTAYGSLASPQITYVHGNASFGGDISGAGIMFIYGTLAWNGTPNFQGLIVSLGGMYTIDGGGTGGNHAGSVVILNAPGGDPVAPFGEAGFDNTGGGTAEYNFDCGALWMAHSLLDPSTGGSMWSPECDTGPGTIWEATPTEMIIASWRENIGWRENFFGSD
ncbi:MAG: pilus assembly PilX N-terminal domain-containing protein [Xanthomonadales bacterium]|nr:pilus assembly PilX N-terminal domain-containing protein [Xanthomonadales bacterium]